MTLTLTLAWFAIVIFPPVLRRQWISWDGWGCSRSITNGFLLPPSPHNFIKPGKRPQSSMCPTIVVDQAGDVRTVIGASGGTTIPSSSALGLMRNLWQGMSMKQGIDSPRIHHQLMPMGASYEDDMDRVKRLILRMHLALK